MNDKIMATDKICNFEVTIRLSVISADITDKDVLAACTDALIHHMPDHAAAAAKGHLSSVCTPVIRIDRADKD